MPKLFESSKTTNSPSLTLNPQERGQMWGHGTEWVGNGFGLTVEDQGSFIYIIPKGQVSLLGEDIIKRYNYHVLTSEVGWSNLLRILNPAKSITLDTIPPYWDAQS